MRYLLLFLLSLNTYAAVQTITINAPITEARAFEGDLKYPNTGAIVGWYRSDLSDWDIQASSEGAAMEFRPGTMDRGLVHFTAEQLPDHVRFATEASPAWTYILDIFKDRAEFIYPYNNFIAIAGVRAVPEPQVLLLLLAGVLLLIGRYGLRTR